MATQMPPPEVRAAIMAKVSLLGELNVAIMNTPARLEGVPFGTQFVHDLARKAIIRRRDELEAALWTLIQPDYRTWEQVRA